MLPPTSNTALLSFFLLLFRVEPFFSAVVLHRLARKSPAVSRLPVMNVCPPGISELAPPKEHPDTIRVGRLKSYRTKRLAEENKGKAEGKQEKGTDARLRSIFAPILRIQHLSKVSNALAHHTLAWTIFPAEQFLSEKNRRDRHSTLPVSNGHSSNQPATQRMVPVRDCETARLDDEVLRRNRTIKRAGHSIYTM